MVRASLFVEVEWEVSFCADFSAAHVWNECWMRRADLPNNEQDWQIVDSTPVPMCDGIRRTGPCPVSSVKQGLLGYRWDSPYIHASVNGNKAHWTVYPDGFMELSGQSCHLSVSAT